MGKDGWQFSKRAAAAFDLVGLTGSTLPPKGRSPADLTAVDGSAADPLRPASQADSNVISKHGDCLSCLVLAPLG